MISYMCVKIYHKVLMRLTLITNWNKKYMNLRWVTCNLLLLTNGWVNSTINLGYPYSAAWFIKHFCKFFPSWFVFYTIRTPKATNIIFKWLINNVPLQVCKSISSPRSIKHNKIIVCSNYCREINYRQLYYMTRLFFFTIN